MGDRNASDPKAARGGLPPARPAPSCHSKLSGALPGSVPDGRVTAIIRVSEPGYVPDHIEVRARIAPDLLTADIAAGCLQTVLDDPRVAAVQLSMPLRTFKKP